MKENTLSLKKSLRKDSIQKHFLREFSLCASTTSAPVLHFSIRSFPISIFTEKLKKKKKQRIPLHQTEDDFKLIGKDEKKKECINFSRKMFWKFLENFPTITNSKKNWINSIRKLVKSVLFLSWKKSHRERKLVPPRIKSSNSVQSGEKR